LASASAQPRHAAVLQAFRPVLGADRVQQLLERIETGLRFHLRAGELRVARQRARTAPGSGAMASKRSARRIRASSFLAHKRGL